MKYYRDWWLATMFWWGFLGLIAVVYIKTNWSSTASGSAFFSQLVALFGTVGLGISAWAMIWMRLRDDFKKSPSKEEREVLKKHADMDDKERVLNQEEKLLLRQQRYDQRREKILRDLELQSGMH